MRQDRLSKWIVGLLAALLVGLAWVACAGPRTQAAEVRVERAASDLEAARAELARARLDGDTQAQLDALEDLVDVQRGELVSALEELAQARVEDTRDTILGLPEILVELVLLGGAGVALSKRRDATRAAEVAALEAKIAEARRAA